MVNYITFKTISIIGLFTIIVSFTYPRVGVDIKRGYNVPSYNSNVFYTPNYHQGSFGWRSTMELN